MDFFVPLVICLIVFILCSLCGWCCRKKSRGAIFSPPVIVTANNTMVPAPPGHTPFPGQQSTIPYVPVGQPPQVGFYPPQQQPPYPVHGVPNMAQMPMPMPQSTYPYPTGNAAQNPPTYDEAVTNEVYTKQSPYNPNYGTH